MSRRTLVTGGTRGIGAAIAKALKNAGYNVVVTFAGNEKAAKEFEAQAGIKTFKWNVANFKECIEGIKNVESYLEGNVEVLINNAGITRDSMMHKMTEENWSDVICTNLNSVFNMSRLVIERMRDSKFGRIISMSSVNANGMLGQTNYAAAKAGIEGFTKSLALESAKLGITVNAIAPGYINTEMVAAIPKEALEKIIARIPVGRLGDVSDIARVAMFLASDEASFITGTVIPVNGALRV